MIGSGVIFALMSSAIRYASHIDCYTSAMVRFAVGFWIVVLPSGAAGHAMGLSDGVILV
jgi:hypothetical protein